MKSVHDDPAYAEVLERMKKLYAGLRDQYRMNEATLPAHRLGQGWWKQRHQQKLREVAEGGHELVFIAGDIRLAFIGDSITQGWEGAGKETWQKFYGDRKALNLGYSGDRTEHVLWRLLNGELENVDPKAYVLMIGTNNTGHRQAPPEETASGIKLILEMLRDRSPDSQILLLSVFPRDQKPDGRMRRINDGVNEIIKGYADGEHIHWLDLSDTFLAEDGTLPGEVMPDFLHPKAEGYRMWAEAMEPTLKKLLE